MSNSTTVFVDPYKMAKRHETMQDTIAVASFGRVTKLLANDTGTIKYHLSFGVDSEGVSYIDGKLNGFLTFCCQRCLQAFTYELNCDFAVSPVVNDSEAKLLPSSYEAVLMQDGKLDVIELLEDELILALPLVAMHAEDAPECKKSIDVSVEEKGEQTHQPFSVLSTLKLNNKGQVAEDSKNGSTTKS